ncbi:hypothetical protein E3P94_00388 [Wallemia ichthyophaga]|nr:hypothetical protein E3P95_00388 [Wallemia ichthyophaga]TIB04994.1 hypothetical protein E3P94_00388 [Wallemia ichthyophaga]
MTTLITCMLSVLGVLVCAIARTIHPPSDLIIAVPPRIPFNAPFQWGYSFNDTNSQLFRFDYTLARLIAPSGESSSQQPNGTLARMFPDNIDKKSTPYEFKLPEGTQSHSSYGKRRAERGEHTMHTMHTMQARSSNIYTIDKQAINTTTPLCLTTTNTSTPSYYEWHNATEPGHWTVEVQSILLYGSNGYEEKGNETCISPPFAYERVHSEAQFSVSTLDVEQVEKESETGDGGTASITTTTTTSTYSPQTSASATLVHTSFSPSPTGNILVSGYDRDAAASQNLTLTLTLLSLSFINGVAEMGSEMDKRAEIDATGRMAGMRVDDSEITGHFDRDGCDGGDGDNNGENNNDNNTSNNANNSNSTQRPLTIVYSTETGNAQDVAERLGRLGERWRWEVRVCEADEFDINTLLTAPIILFVLSTTGNGEHNPTFRSLWRQLLNSRLPSDLLDGLVYGVFGLGDSSYARFNWAAKSLDRRLDSLGAQRVVGRGDGDERHYMGYDGVFLPWSGVLFNNLNHLLPLPKGVDKLDDDYLPPPRVKMEWLNGSGSGSGSKNSSSSNTTNNTNTPPNNPSTPYTCTLDSSTRLTSPSWWQDVRHLVLNTPPTLPPFRAGDVAVLQPRNEPSAISNLVRQLGWEECADELLLLCDRQSSHSDNANHDTQTHTTHLPSPLQRYTHTPTTLRHLLTYHLSPYAVPRTTFFEYLAHFTSSDVERERLREFTSAQGADELYEYCARVRRTAPEVLDDFKSVRIPPRYALDVFPLLRPRKFSIAGSKKSHSHAHASNQLQLCIALVRYKTKLARPRMGICSAWLESLKQGDEVHVGVEEGTIRAPRRVNGHEDADEHADNNLTHTPPLLLVGPGTGVAPMRALVQERERDIHTQPSAQNTALYFGCRCSGMDELYADEMQSLARAGRLHYRVAHSRDDVHGNKEYVQHLLQQDGKRVYNWLVERSGYLFISGSSGQMPKGVRKAVASIIERLEGVDENTAMRKVEYFESIGRIVEECW